MYSATETCAPVVPRRRFGAIGCVPLSNLYYLVATATLFLAVLVCVVAFFRCDDKKDERHGCEKKSKGVFEDTNTIVLFLLFVALIFAVLIVAQKMYEFGGKAKAMMGKM